MRAHLKHLLMCSPMIALAVILLIATGSAAALLPAVACVAMMAVMMSMMSRGGHD